MSKEALDRYLVKPMIERPSEPLVEASARQDFVLGSIESFMLANRLIYNQTERAARAVELAGGIQRRLGWDQLDSPINPAEVPAKTLVDLLDWQAQQRYYFYKELNLANSQTLEAHHQHYLLALDARARYYADLADYDEYFGSDPRVYFSLLDGFNQTRVLMNNAPTETLREIDNGSDRLPLGEVLGRYSIMKYLQNSGFAIANLTDSLSTRHGADIALNIFNGNQRINRELKLWPKLGITDIKASQPNPHGPIWLRVPLYGNPDHPFDLSKTDKKNLKTGIRSTLQTTPRVLGKTALQTDRKQLELAS